MDVSQHFSNFFLLEHCRSDATINECKKLRYDVFCSEKGYFIDNNQSKCIESDEYDSRSVHSLIRHRTTNRVAATVRLVLANEWQPEDPFPIEHFEVLRRMERDQKWRINRASLAEISRFAIAQVFRRRTEERNKIHGITDEVFREYHNERRQIGDLTLGLFKAVVAMSYENDISHWYAMMEPKLIRLLSRYGIRFNTVGPIFNHCGLRQPCIASVNDVLSGIYHSRRDVWSFITNDGSTFGRDYLCMDASAAI